MAFDRIFVLGAGAIGSAFGALLSRKFDVTLFGNKQHVETVKLHGLKLSGDVDGVFYPEAELEINSLPPNTLLIVTTKVHRTFDALNSIKHLMHNELTILLLQNGLGNKELARKAVGDKPNILRGITSAAAEFFQPGKVRFWFGKTLIENGFRSNEIAEMFNSCGLKTEVSKDIKTEVWRKLVVNCVINPLTAIFCVKNFEIASDELKSVRHAIVDECLKVAEAEGVHLSKDLAEMIDSVLGNYTNYSSMCQDVMKGKPTEIDFINGKVVELGRKHGIPTPINQVLVNFIKFIESHGHEFCRKN